MVGPESTHGGGQLLAAPSLGSLPDEAGAIRIVQILQSRMRHGRQGGAGARRGIAPELDHAPVSHAGMHGEGLGPGSREQRGVRHVRSRHDVIGRDQVRDELVARVGGTARRGRRSGAGHAHYLHEVPSGRSVPAIFHVAVVHSVVVRAQ